MKLEAITVSEVEAYDRLFHDGEFKLITHRNNFDAPTGHTAFYLVAADNDKSDSTFLPNNMVVLVART